MKEKKVVLVIMDGWGNALKNKSNAIAAAHTPFIDSCYQHYPHSQLFTSGLNVGLPNGQMGNSEVGHLNIGAGRIVYQELALINKSIDEHSLDTNATLLTALSYAKINRKKLHLMGLVSDGGVHSHINHLKALCEIVEKNGLEHFYIHAFTDGRDCDPKSGKVFMQELSNHLLKTGGKIATITGRYYAMDRDKRWERIKIAYDVMVNGIGHQAHDAVTAMQESYDAGFTDEFIKPICLVENEKPVALIEEGDVVICFNFRTDRCREITEVLTQENNDTFNMHTIPLHYVTMTNYDDRFKNVSCIFEKDNLINTLGEVLEKAGKKQIRMAETEKYPHVTFFFSGGREKEFEGEKRIMIASPKVATYDLQPEMSAFALKDALLNELRKNEFDFVCINFANADMVGHTGIFSAAVKAVETVDACVKEIVECGLTFNYSFLITADHGNAEYMLNEDGSPNTAHTTNPVPLFLIEKENQHTLHDGKLADLAPTVLAIMKIEPPPEMTGKSLII
jgi:2,3-bisphosphoglycerate-independent phosphoglycerate mutase